MLSRRTGAGHATEGRNPASHEALSHDGSHGGQSHDGSTRRHGGAEFFSSMLSRRTGAGHATGGCNPGSHEALSHDGSHGDVEPRRIYTETRRRGVPGPDELWTCRRAAFSDALADIYRDVAPASARTDAVIVRDL